jgi:hypothetical protein
MVRDASRRAAKYEGKIDADVARSRILALKTSMVDQMTSVSADLATLETEVKRVIEGQATPIYGHQIPAYLNFGRELWKLSRKFGATTFQAEADACYTKWEAKGLDVAVLGLVGKLFGFTPSS